MKKRILRNSATYKPEKGVVIEGVSLTVPDASYTVKDLLIKFSSGSAPPVLRSGNYPEEEQSFGNVDISSMPNFDLADVTEIMLKIEDRQRENDSIRKKYAEYKKDLQIKKEKEAIKAAAEKQIADERESKASKSNTST